MNTISIVSPVTSLPVTSLPVTSLNESSSASFFYLELSLHKAQNLLSFKQKFIEAKRNFGGGLQNVVLSTSLGVFGVGASYEDSEKESVFYTGLDESRSTGMAMKLDDSEKPNDIKIAPDSFYNKTTAVLDEGGIFFRLGNIATTHRINFSVIESCVEELKQPLETNKHRSSVMTW